VGSDPDQEENASPEPEVKEVARGGRGHEEDDKVKGKQRHGGDP
jgi:hypothetical protein